MRDMRSVRELLEGLDLPAICTRPAAEYRLPSVHALGAALPQGHLHVWSGEPGAGKTAFLAELAHSLTELTTVGTKAAINNLLARVEA